MCNSYISKFNYTELVEVFSHLKLPILSPGSDRAPNVEPRDSIRPTEQAFIMRPMEGGVEMASLRWGFAPARPKAGPVINFRSEGRRFTKGRCLIPASAFHEFTGAGSPKTKWQFTKVHEPLFCIAGLWRPAEGAGSADAFTMLTCEPGPDVAPYHNRQIVILERRDWAEWLNAEVADPALLQPLPAGSLSVQRVSPAPKQGGLFEGSEEPS